MTLEELIYHRLIQSTEITGCLASFSTQPAVFYQMAPDDQQKEWKGCQYPRIIYDMDMQANQDRKSAGTLVISLLCDEAGTEPEKIEPYIRESLKDLIVRPDQSSPYCFAWSRTDTFEIPERESSASTRIIGMEVRFDILEYPSQETANPDPVAAFNRFIKTEIPEAFVFGVDTMENFLIPALKRPVCYCRLEAVELLPENSMIGNTVAWMNCRAAVHVLCPNQETRLKLIMMLTNDLAAAGRVTMLDGSPMNIQGLKVNNQADYLREGQITVSGKYGILKYREKGTALKFIKTIDRRDTGEKKG